MNFNTLVNTQGLKGSRRGGEKSGFKKAVGATKDVTVKAATTVMGWAPATTNRVNRVENESLTRDRELIHEVRKNREAIDEMRTILGLHPVPTSTPEEVQEAVLMMETYAHELKEQSEIEDPSNSMLKKLQKAISVINKHLPEETPPNMKEAVVEAPVQEVQTGTTRRFVSTPEASDYDYSQLTEDTAATEEN